MLVQNLPVDENDKHNKVNKANKIYVNTNCSNDGHYKEGYWLDYSIATHDGANALVLLEITLNTSQVVDFYSVYDSQGEIEKKYNPKHRPKRI